MALTANAAHTQVQLLLSADTARPGDTIWAGVDMKMDPDWHTYWKNPGAAGMATKIQWQLPPGVTAGDIQWPLPEKLPPAEVTTYGYNNEVVLLVPLKVAADLKPGMALDLKANVSWLECKEECIPGSANVEGNVEHRPGNQKFRRLPRRLICGNALVPQASTNFLAGAWWQESAKNDIRPLIIQCTDLLNKGLSPIEEQPNTCDFFPDANDQFEIQPATEIISAHDLNFRIRKGR